MPRSKRPADGSAASFELPEDPLDDLFTEDCIPVGPEPRFSRAGAILGCVPPKAIYPVPIGPLLNLNKEQDQMPDQPKPGMILKEWKSIVKNTLRGFATVELPIGLIIKDVTIHVKGDRRWASLPARPQIDREGCQRKDETGKPLYANILEFATRERADQFSARVVQLVEAQHGSLG